MFLRSLDKAPMPQQIAIFRTITDDQLLSIRICCYYFTVVKLRLPSRYKEILRSQYEERIERLMHGRISLAAKRKLLLREGTEFINAILDPILKRFQKVCDDNLKWLFWWNLYHSWIGSLQNMISKKHRPFLQLLCSSDTLQRHALLETAKPEQIQGICNCIHNVFKMWCTSTCTSGHDWER